MFDGGEIGWGVAGTDVALVVAKDHIHDPMEAILDGPMLTDDGGELVGGVG